MKCPTINCCHWVHANQTLLCILTPTFSQAPLWLSFSALKPSTSRLRTGRTTTTKVSASAVENTYWALLAWSFEMELGGYFSVQTILLIYSHPVFVSGMSFERWSFSVLKQEWHQWASQEPPQADLSLYSFRFLFPLHHVDNKAWLFRAPVDIFSCKTEGKPPPLSFLSGEYPGLFPCPAGRPPKLLNASSDNSCQK